MLKPADRSLAQTHDLVVFDLDGVVYVGRQPVDGAVAALERTREAGTKIGFVTNNAARPPDSVADHLRALGIAAQPDDVVTSAQAAAGLLSHMLPSGSAVYLIGGEGLDQALGERGLRPVTTPDDPAVAVVQGYGPTMPWRQVVDGAILVASGLPWVASNTDMTLPTEHGLGPGNGALVDLVARFAHRDPVVAGKPGAALFEETLARIGGDRPLYVGDRLDTDIAGAVAVGWDCLLVMTGVTGLRELVTAPSAQRPTFVGADLDALLEAQPAVEEERVNGDLRATCGGWSATTDSGALRVTGEGSPSDWWRAVAVAAWAHLDDTGSPVDTADLLPTR